MSTGGSRVWRTFGPLVLVCAGCYVGLILILRVFQSRFVYFPEREMAATPQDVGLSYDAVDFEAADGPRLCGWFVPAEEPRAIILFCHGNAGNISHRLDSIQLFHRLGLSTFLFDYRGYGGSEGKPTERGTYLDAEAAWCYLTEERRASSSEIIVFGRSLGGAIAAWLARSRGPRALIVESTFTSVPDVAAELYPYLPARLLSVFDYNTAECLREVSCPVLVVHSRDDEMISFRHGERLFGAAGEPKEFLEIAGTHNEGFLTSGRRYEESLDSFVSRYAGD